jgi:hypothetical protein
MEEIFYGYSIDAACDFGPSRFLSTYFLGQLYAKQNRPKNYVQYCILSW